MALILILFPLEVVPLCRFTRDVVQKSCLQKNYVKYHPSVVAPVGAKAWRELADW